MKDEKSNKGFIKIPNKMIETLAQAYLPNYEMRLLLAILRKTLGWNKESDVISFTQLSKMTNIDRGNLKTASDRLSARGVITVSKFKNKNVYSINLSFNNWKFSKKRRIVMSGYNTKNVMSGNNKMLSLHTTKLLSLDTHTKDKTKTTNQKTNSNFVASSHIKASNYQSSHTQLQQLVVCYVKLHQEKHGFKPTIQKADWQKWGKLLKLRLQQGLDIKEVIELLEVFAGSDEAKRTAFNLNVFLSGSIFDQMRRLKSKQNIVSKKRLEENYGKWQ